MELPSQGAAGAWVWPTWLRGWRDGSGPLGDMQAPLRSPCGRRSEHTTPLQGRRGELTAANGPACQAQGRTAGDGQRRGGGAAGGICPRPAVC